MKRRKILFLITKATWGGAQRYVFDLATNLDQGNFEPVALYGDEGILSQKLQAAGIQAHRISALGRNIALISDISSFFQILAAIREIEPDIVHLNSSKAAALGVLAARIAGVKKILFTVHGWPFKEQRNTAARAFIYIVSWLTALLSHTVIVLSKKDELLGHRMMNVGRKIRTIPLGISAPEFLSRVEAEKALLVTSTHPRIVTIAELTANKGIRYAIDAIAELKTRGIAVDYFVIGDGEERSLLEHRAQERGVSDCVHFFGFKENAASYLNAFDVFLLPSIKEGMPYVLLEAAAAGLPVVGTDVIDVSFSANYPAATSSKPGDATSLSKAIQEVVGKKVASPFSFPLRTMVQQHEVLYSNN